MESSLSTKHGSSDQSYSCDQNIFALDNLGMCHMGELNECVCFICYGSVEKTTCWFFFVKGPSSKYYCL